jgi:integrase
VNRKLAALTSFCEFHARHGVPLAGAAGHDDTERWPLPGIGHHVQTVPASHQQVRFAAATDDHHADARARAQVLTAEQVQAILDACEHLRDRLLFGLLLDTGIFSGGPRVTRP